MAIFKKMVLLKGRVGVGERGTDASWDVDD